MTRRNWIIYWYCNFGPSGFRTLMTRSVSSKFDDFNFHRYLAIWYTILDPNDCIQLIVSTAPHYTKPKFLTYLIYWYTQLGTEIGHLMTKKVASKFLDREFQNYLAFWYTILDHNFVRLITGTVPHLYTEPNYTTLLLRILHEKGKEVLENTQDFTVINLNTILEH